MLPEHPSSFMQIYIDIQTLFQWEWRQLTSQTNIVSTFLYILNYENEGNLHRSVRSASFLHYFLYWSSLLFSNEKSNQQRLWLNLWIKRGIWQLIFILNSRPKQFFLNNVNGPAISLLNQFLRYNVRGLPAYHFSLCFLHYGDSFLSCSQWTIDHILEI